MNQNGWGELAGRFADCQQFFSFAAVPETLVLLKNERKPIAVGLSGPGVA